MLEIEHVTKKYDGRAVVDDIRLEVHAGEVFGLLGPNGAGKSTTMSMVAGLIRPDGGTIRIDGETMKPLDLSQRRKKGIAPQELALYFDLTGRENLQFFCSLHGYSGSEVKQRVNRILDRTGLEKHADKPVGTYSGGMKRRLNFGVAILHEPRLLMLDEPTVGVDTQSRAHLLDNVRELASQGVAVIYASHYMDEVQSICHRAAIMDQGKVMACDTIQGHLNRVPGWTEIRLIGWDETIRPQVQELAQIVPDSGEDIQLRLLTNEQDNRVAVEGKLAALLTLLESHGIALKSIETHHPNLERLFLELTGRELRDRV